MQNIIRWSPWFLFLLICSSMGPGARTGPVRLDHSSGEGAGARQYESESSPRKLRNVSLNGSVLHPTLHRDELTVREGEIVVFRHHPGKHVPDEMAAKRNKDVEIVLAAVRKAKLDFTYEGGWGRGFKLTLNTRDLRQWKMIIGDLMESKSLGYYTDWGLDVHGYGIIDVR